MAGQANLDDSAWSSARLIPTSGIAGADEQERRATSALLAVMSVVKDFSRTLLQPLGAPAGVVETFIEVPFDLDGRRLYPDGLIRVTRGAKVWTALVEVKTGRNLLQTDQLSNYLDIARDNGIDYLITISNEIPASADVHPTAIDKRKLRKVAIHHWSWSHILSTAVVQKEHRGVSDPEQAWILGELIRYLEHPKSGALEFEDMGANWVSVRESVIAGTLRTSDKTIGDVVSRFDALMRFASLRLGRQLGTEVRPVLSRRESAEPGFRSQSLVASLVGQGEMVGTIRIPNTVSDLVVTANLRSGRITVHVDVDAPREGRNTTRVNWLVRQLKNATDDVRIESYAANARGSGAAELLGAVRANPAVLVLDASKELRSFRIARTVPMGTKAGTGRGAFIDSCIAIVESFYADVLQNLRAWNAPVPQLKDVPDAPAPQLVDVPPEIADIIAPSEPEAIDPDGPRFAGAPVTFEERLRTVMTAGQTPDADPDMVGA